MNYVKRAAALAMSFLLAVGTISTTVFAQDTTADEQPDVAFDAERSGFNNETQRYELYFVINENTDAAEVDVEVSDYFIQMIDAHEAYLVPGDKFQADVYIENASGHTYAYQSGGLSVSTPGFGSEEELSPFVGFDGKQIPYASIAAMSTDDEVISSLFGGSTRLQLNDLLGIYDRLAEEGYEGEDALTAYTLDYYRTKDGVDYADWADFIEQSGPSYGNDFGTVHNSIYEVPADVLETLLSQYPDMEPFVRTSATTSDGDLRVQVLYPEAELATIHYEYFYKDLMSLGFSEEICEQMNPNSGTDFTRVHGVGDYMDTDSALYAEADAYFLSLANADALDKGETLGENGFRTAIALDGPGMGNSYMIYAFGYSNVITLSRIDTTYTVEHRYYTSTDGGAYVLDGTVLSDPISGNVGDVITVADIEKISEYNGNTYTWVSSEDAITLTIRAEDNHIVLEYRRDVKTTDPTDPVDPNEPQDPQTPTAPDDPETGIGDTLALWGILLGASAALAAALGVKRKISR